MSLINNLNWRYATKKMNGQTVQKEKLDYILEAARLAPSSSGLQPYRIFVISDRKVLEKIKEAAFNQSQITDCSHLIVWAAWDSYSSEKIGDVMVKTSRERGLPDNASEEYGQSLWSNYQSLGEEWHKNHAAKQAYISFGLAIAAAAEQQVDATPMEGFDSVKLDEILGLEALGLKSVVILPVGYRDEQHDWLVNLKKVRTPKEEFITVID
ncbi:NAD(P)H-dependent oxidoreductase [Proteiniphilum acetatigenes]|uniref:NAD(P)H-dependent oxidoreductase n=1 Tax=Proteiniphilum acetatigenes TaxID=294710 RepID=UPI0003788BE5|nr:NAD(P)H-dependent oxidoreductase [Proteiniphilum acetatigenes]